MSGKPRSLPEALELVGGYDAVRYAEELPDELVEALADAPIVAEADLGGPPSSFTARERQRELTASELRCLRAAARGLTAQGTAVECHLTIETVKSQRQAVLRKLHAANIAHAVALGYEAGLL